MLATHEFKACVPWQTSEESLHAYFTLSSQACMKHNKHLFAVSYPAPPPSQNQLRSSWENAIVGCKVASLEKDFDNASCGTNAKRATLPVLVIKWLPPCFPDRKWVLFSEQLCPQLAFLYLTPWAFNNPTQTQDGQHKRKQAKKKKKKESQISVYKVTTLAKMEILHFGLNWSLVS